MADLKIIENELVPVYETEKELKLCTEKTCIKA